VDFSLYLRVFLFSMFHILSLHTIFSYSRVIWTLVQNKHSSFKMLVALAKVFLALQEH
jgi:hypothetical protein